MKLSKTVIIDHCFPPFSPTAYPSDCYWPQLPIIMASLRGLIMRWVGASHPLSRSSSSSILQAPRLLLGQQQHNGVATLHSLTTGRAGVGASIAGRTTSLGLITPAASSSLWDAFVNPWSAIQQRWSSTLKKRRTKMNKHKLKKRRKLLRGKNKKNL